jgi:hypothetical protein
VGKIAAYGLDELAAAPAKHWSELKVNAVRTWFERFFVDFG